MFGMKRDEPDKVAPLIREPLVPRRVAPIAHPVAALESPANEVEEAAAVGWPALAAAAMDDNVLSDSDAWVGEARAAVDLLNRLADEDKLALRLLPHPSTSPLVAVRLVARTVYEEEEL